MYIFVYTYKYEHVNTIMYMTVFRMCDRIKSVWPAEMYQYN